LIDAPLEWGADGMKAVWTGS